ncbi:triacylglycerol lipase [Nocardioides sp. Root190]|uniref:lipase family protein n=1 Tax=Nocardioides sp. Root190 TaxID=1736488 RepID=UPI0006F868F5|nr:lipase family protein [Nocardioides sp. Root190]KRB72775.1 triacylglycerol lipase [Nocardioides sp. Root190]
MVSRFVRRTSVVAVLVTIAALLAPSGQGAQAAPRPVSAVAAAPAGTPDPFFTYSGTRPLKDLAPGTILARRTIPYNLVGIKLPLQVVQILFRTTDARGRAVAGVTSILKPLLGATGKVISYQSFYDSLNPEDGPSRAYSGAIGLGVMIGHVETVLVGGFLLQGYAIVIADTQGPTADFAAGPEYGQVTLDSLRAALKAPGTGILPGAKVGLIGYSGGAIATNWAAALAPSYAPEINKRIVGAAEGGVLVRPSKNLEYIDGSLVWAGVMPMAIVGVARAYGIDLLPYLNDYGRKVYAKLEKASIVQVLGAYPGLTWKKMTKPAYADPADIPIFVATVNKLNLGQRPSPTIPMFIGQGTGGELEGTLGNRAGVGRGDGVMVAGDVRTLARQYCAAGTEVVHKEYALSHFTSVPLWLPDAMGWLSARFAGKAPTDNCAKIPAGNPLTPLKAG